MVDLYAELLTILEKSRPKWRRRQWSTSTAKFESGGQSLWHVAWLPPTVVDARFGDVHSTRLRKATRMAAKGFDRSTCVLSNLQPAF